MSFLKLTEACDSFTYKINTSNVVLNWEVTLYLKHITGVSLRQILINHVKPMERLDEYTYHPIYCNLIERTATNPKREIHRAILLPYEDILNDSNGIGKTLIILNSI